MRQDKIRESSRDKDSWDEFHPWFNVSSKQISKYFAEGSYANNSDENKYICFDPTKFTASEQVTFNGYTTSCDLWIDAAQGSGQVFYGITFDSTFDASAQTTTVQNGLKMYAGPYGGNGLDCCSDGKSAAFKNYTYFCQDPND
jgi:hypothetical protein